MLGVLQLAAGALAGGISTGSLRAPQIRPPIGALIRAYVTAGAVVDHPTGAQIGPVLG